MAHYYIENTGTTTFNTVANELVRQLLLHCEVRIPWMLESVYEKLHPTRAPDLQRALALLRSFTLSREGVIYENTWLVLDGFDGLRDGYDSATMRNIFRQLSAFSAKGCFVLMSMKNDYYKYLNDANILNKENHSEISVDPNAFPSVYEEYTKLELQRRGHEVSMRTRQLGILVRMQ